MNSRPDVAVAAFNQTLDKIYYGRKRIRDLTREKSPPDAKSKTSKRSKSRRQTKVEGLGSGGYQSINES